MGNSGFTIGKDGKVGVRLEGEIMTPLYEQYRLRVGDVSRPFLSFRGFIEMILEKWNEEQNNE